MKKILLVCAAGMSTSMLVKRMIDHATAISLEVNISALAIAEAKGKIKNNEVDVVLLGGFALYFQTPVIRLNPLLACCRRYSVASDAKCTMRMPFVIMLERLCKGSLLPLTRLVWA